MYRRFEQLMNDRGMTHYQVWRATGVAQSSLSGWRRGISVPTAANLIKIAALFDVTVPYLLGEEPETENAPIQTDERESDAVYQTIMKLTPENRENAMSYIRWLTDHAKERPEKP